MAREARDRRGSWAGRLCAVAAGGLALLAVGCSKAESATPPTLSNLSASFVGAVPQDGSATIDFDFSDSGGDVVSGRMVVRDTSGAVVHDESDDLSAGLAGVTSAHLYVTLDLSTFPTGTWTLEFTVRDSAGAISNMLSVALRVLPGFGPAVVYPAPRDSQGHPFGLGATAVGDLDGDGRKDVAVLAGLYGQSLVAIYRQTATGTLADPQVVGTDVMIGELAIADVTGDGREDLVVAGTSMSGLVGPLGRVVVWPQRPDGSLGEAIAWPFSGNGGGSLAVADVDGDGRKDVVVGDCAVYVLFQDAGGALGGEASVAPAADWCAAGEIEVADLDHDGRLDLVFQAGPKQLAVARQSALRTFAAPVLYEVPTSYWPSFAGLGVGDLDGDGRTDVVTVELTGWVDLFLQDASGKLAFARHLEVGSPAGVQVADLDGDGLDDLAVDAGTFITVVFQGPDHAFADRIVRSLPTTSYGGQSENEALSIGDVTGDGAPDLVSTWGTEGLFVMRHW